jgi:hypothetical protein
VILERERESSRCFYATSWKKQRERESESRGIKDCFDTLLLRVRANKVTAVFLVI